MAKKVEKMVLPQDRMLSWETISAPKTARIPYDTPETATHRKELGTLVDPAKRAVVLKKIRDSQVFILIQAVPYKTYKEIEEDCKTAKSIFNSKKVPIKGADGGMIEPGGRGIASYEIDVMRQMLMNVAAALVKPEIPGKDLQAKADNIMEKFSLQTISDLSMEINKISHISGERVGNFSLS